jgi:CTP-dependent riboflavin kinase
MKKLAGIVRDGKNDANVWLARFAHAYATWLGQDIFPGSLNVEVGGPFDWHAADIVPFRRRFSQKPHGGDRDLFMIPCTIVSPGSQLCWLSTTTTAADDKDDRRLVELIAPVQIRTKLSVTDASRIEVEYPC